MMRSNIKFLSLFSNSYNFKMVTEKIMVKAVQVTPQKIGFQARLLQKLPHPQW